MPKRTQPMIMKNHHISIKSRIMKTDYFRLIVFTLLITIISCGEKEKIGNDMPINIETNKSSYSNKEIVTFLFENTTDSIAYYYKCSSYDGIPYSIFKLENKSWNFYWGPMCDGYRSYCCPTLLPGTIGRDTLNMELEAGIYKLEYSFIVRPSHDYVQYYSNTFKIE
jgi:hypothetical protein